MSSTDDIRGLMARLHRIQTQLGDLNGRLRRGPLVIKTQEGNVQKALAELEKLKEVHRQLVLEAKKKEQEVSASDQAIAKRKTQLAEAKTNKEFQALQQQIQADEAARSVLEDEALEAGEKAEKFVGNFTKVEAELAKSKELLENGKKKFTAEKPEIDAQIAHCTDLLHEAEKELPSDFREVYDRLVRSVGGSDALAVVETKYCGGCNHQVPINSLAMILQKKPITCSSCARLLYVPEGYVFDRG